MLAAQPSDYYLAAIDTALRAGVMATPSMGLFVNTPTLSNTTTVSAMTEPTYTGYARTAMTLEAIQRDVAGDYKLAYGSVHFQPTGTVTDPIQCNGYFVTATVTEVAYLLFSEYFATPQVISSEFSGFDVLFENYIKNLLTWGGFCSVC
jgi:hypothetical protein